MFPVLYSLFLVFHLSLLHPLGPNPFTPPLSTVYSQATTRMAANKVAAMVYRSTNKITLILIYALLEWTLIILLLLNSLFSYLIIKFAQHFGLNPPCLWCSRLDHIFEPGKHKNYPIDLLCKVHLAEVSKLGFCSNHQRFAESQDMCQNCFSSTAHFKALMKNFPLSRENGMVRTSDGDFQALMKNFPFSREYGMVRTSDGVAGVGKEEVIFKCCCCGECLESGKYCDYNLIKSSSWEALELSDKRILIKDVEDDDSLEVDMKTHIHTQYFVSDHCGKQFFCEKKKEELVVSEVDSGFVLGENDKTEEGFLCEYDEPQHKENEIHREREVTVDEIEGKVMKDKSVQVSFGEDAYNENLGQHLEFFFDGSGHRLVPFELIDSPKMEHIDRCASTDFSQDYVDTQGAHLDLAVNLNYEDQLGAEMEPEAACWPRDEEESKDAILESMEMAENKKSLVFHAREFPSLKELLDQIAITQGAQEFKPMAASEEDEKHSDAEVSIGTEIPDLDTADDIHPQDMLSENECSEENPLTSCSSYSDKQAEEHSVNLRSFPVELSDHEEVKVPDTPTSVDSTQNFSKKSLYPEKKDSGAEDSLEGSLISEMECGDGILNVERLKSALRSEHQTLQALYAELEEERSASAVAANQTMAMINRLQEEKAQMQMEALQYQRMMEEQSEYDQEALQLLNELMVKREKEKQQLEKEVETYRRKVVEYETREKLRIFRKSKEGSHQFGFSSASCSNADDSDALSIDLNQEVKEEDGFYAGNEEYCNGNSPVEAVLNLEESLHHFEDERLSILEHLKALEVKLMNLGEEENLNNSEDNISPLEQFPEENGFHNKLENGYSKEINVKNHQERKSIGVKGRSLLPLFDAVNDENGDAELDGIADGYNNSSNGWVHEDLINDNKKMKVEEQVDHLHERLQALEADREFLKHCMSSLRKGDKGVHLLVEILQHLRDLKNVELRLRNSDDDVVLSC